MPVVFLINQNAKKKFPEFFWGSKVRKTARRYGNVLQWYKTRSKMMREYLLAME